MLLVVKQVTGGVLNGGGVPYVSEVIQSSRCTLMTERLFRGFGVRLLAKLISRWFDLKFKIINCIAAGWAGEAIDEFFGRSIYLSGFDLSRTSRITEPDRVDRI